MIGEPVPLPAQLLTFLGPDGAGEVFSPVAIGVQQRTRVRCEVGAAAAAVRQRTEPTGLR